MTGTSRIPWPVVFRLIPMLQTRSWCRFYHIWGRGTQKWWNYLCRTHAWPRQWLWRHDFRDLSYFFQCKWHRIDVGVDFTIFEFEKLESDETIYVKLTCDLANECDVTISVTCHSYSYANDTISMLVSILPYSRLRNSKMRKEMTYHSRVT